MSEPTSIGRYDILGEIGRGAMGVVYKARDPKMDRIVAVKTIQGMALSGPQAQEYRDRFTREARAAGRLSHPGIVAVYDVGDHGGTPYLVMEYVEGRTLESSLNAGERFPFDRIEELGEQLAAALGYAHRNGVVHRDIKPANILLTKPDAQSPERAKITDLGIAKLSASQITTTGQLLGTPSYMPPEQFTGAPVDGRADIFSLGVILYWMSTGDKPFSGDTITAVSYKIVHTDTIPPRRLNPAVPEGLEHIILRCLEKDPARRYQTGEALAQDLATVRAGGSVAAPPAHASAEATTIVGGDPNRAPRAAASRAGGDESTTMAGPPSSRVVTPATQSALPQKAGAPRPAAKIHYFGLIAGGIAVLGFILIVAGIMKHRRQAAQLAQQTPAPVTATSTEAPAQPPPVEAQAAPSVTPPTTPESAPSSVAVTPQPPPGKGAPSEASSTNTNPPTGAIRPAKKSPGKTQNPPGKKAGSTPDTGAGKAEPPKPESAPAKNPEQQQAPAPPAPAASTPAQPAKAEKHAELKPEESAKLHVDVGRVPDAAGFVLVMDGKPFYQRSGAGTPANPPDEILLPPGQHEFKVVAAQGSVKLGASNSVRGDFEAKKKKTLRIELRDAASGKTLGKSAKVADGSADFIISFKTGLF